LPRVLGSQVGSHSLRIAVDGCKRRGHESLSLRDVWAAVDAHRHCSEVYGSERLGVELGEFVESPPGVRQPLGLLAGSLVFVERQRPNDIPADMRPVNLPPIAFDQVDQSFHGVSLQGGRYRAVRDGECLDAEAWASPPFAAASYV